MSNAPKQEILPPEPVAAAAGGGGGDDDRYFHGKAGPGRPKGSPNTTTRELKDAIMKAFNDIGGSDYLLFIAGTRPDLFLPLLGKVLPLKLEPGEGEAVVEYRYITHEPMPLKKK